MCDYDESTGIAYFRNGNLENAESYDYDIRLNIHDDGSVEGTLYLTLFVDTLENITPVLLEGQSTNHKGNLEFEGTFLYKYPYMEPLGVTTIPPSYYTTSGTFELNLR